MEQFREIIELEEQRIKHVVEEMHATLAEEQKEHRKIDQEISSLKQQKLDAVGWREKRDVDDQIDACRQRHGMRHYQDAKALRRPYFGILELKDEDLGSLSYALGTRSFFGRNSQVLVIDWREAPISRLFYEYETGEAYEEDIGDRERFGVIQSKRQVETSDGKLLKIAENGCLLVRGEDNVWRNAADAEKTGSRKKAETDHRLPEITALISKEQFRTITRADSGMVLLQGGAGSGKTTVGLHRIAYLAYHRPERFGQNRILVVMFNRSLRRYISRALPELGVEKGVLIETYHSWAAKLFRMANTRITYASDAPPPAVTRFKKHTVVLALVDRYLHMLLNKSRDWLLDRLQEHQDPDVDRIASMLKAVTQFDHFSEILNTHPLFVREPRPVSRKHARDKILERLNEHGKDLHAALSDQELLDEVLSESTFGGSQRIVGQIAARQTMLREKNQIDFADTGILLWLMQRKGVSAAQPGYSHIMVDEAQDLSEVELATLLYAADTDPSVTICGDMAQKIKGDVSFENPRGFAGFIQDLQERTGNRKVCAETLTVGYRATRPIMELAWHVLGGTSGMAVPRKGEPVVIIRTRNYEETAAQSHDILRNYVEACPNGLVGVVCRYKADADQIFGDLKALGLENLRRHQRGDFSFHPGVIVTNAHQVKGLEFSAVLVVNPGSGQYRGNQEDRMLLHVVMTRASDRLWLVGHQPMAYELEAWELTEHQEN